MREFPSLAVSGAVGLCGCTERKPMATRFQGTGHGSLTELVTHRQARSLILVRRNLAC